MLFTDDVSAALSRESAETQDAVARLVHSGLLVCAEDVNDIVFWADRATSGSHLGWEPHLEAAADRVRRR